MLGLSDSTADRWAQVVSTAGLAVLALIRAIIGDRRLAVVSGALALLLAGAAGWRARKLLWESRPPSPP